MIASSQLHNQLSIQNLSIFKKNLTTYRFPTFGSIIFRSFILVTYVFLIVFRLLFPLANVSIHCSFWSLVIINYDIFSFFNFFYVKVVEDNPSYWDVISSALAVGWQEIVVSGYRIFT